MRQCLYYLLVFAAVLIAGCVQSETKVQNQDLLRIASVTVTPSTVVAPDEIITIRMKLDNIGQEAVNFTMPERSNECVGGYCYRGVGKYALAGILYDYCSSLYSYDSGSRSAAFSIIADGFTEEDGFASLKPGRSAILEWMLRAPSEEKIARMKQECPFKFQVSYRANARTYTYIYFANPVEKEQRVYTNKDLNLKGENVANFGPVFLNFETAQDQPIKGTSAINPNYWTLYVNANNVGNGIGKIQTDTNALSITIPEKIRLPLSGGYDMQKNCPFFAYNDATGRLEYKIYDSSTILDQNVRLLKLYSQQTSRFSCTLPSPEVSVLDPYLFVSSSDYVYTIDKEIKITTMPKG